MEAMLSSFAPVFYGDLRSHERVISMIIVMVWSIEFLSLHDLISPN